MTPSPPPRPRNSHGEYISLQEHFESRLNSIEKAITLAAGEMRERLAGMNEFRETLRDQASKFATREEVGIRFDSILDRISQLELSRAKLEGKADQSATNIALALALLGLALGVFSLILDLVR